MILNKMYNGFTGNTEVKKIYLGDVLIFPEEKFLNINWNLTNVTITSYLPGEPAEDNANDRPRINTFRTDGNFVIYLSAGNNVFDPILNTISQPWGNRSAGTYNINFPLLCALSGGVDFFTSYYLTAVFGQPEFTPPLSDPNWVVKGEPTGNEGEVKYQYLFSRNTPTPLNIFVGYNPTNPTEPLNFNAVEQDRQVFFTWDPPVSQGNTPITNYELQYSTNQVNWLTVNTGNVNSYTLTGLNNGTNYYFRIRSVNGSSLLSPFTPTIGPLSPYLILRITAESVSGMLSSMEFIEIENVSPHEGRIDGWVLESHAVTSTTPHTCERTIPPTTFTIPNGNYIIPSGGKFRIISGTGASTLNNPPSIFAWRNTNEWNDDGDVADLYNPQGVWVDTLATGGCLYDVTGYLIEFNSGAGNTVTSIPVYPSLAAYEELDLVPSPWTRDSGLVNSSGPNTGWRMRSSGVQSTSIQNSLNTNKTLTFSIQNINNGNVRHFVGSFKDLVLTRNSFGPTRLAVVTNKTNNWTLGSYLTLIDIDFITGSQVRLDNLLAQALNNNNQSVTINPGETIYFKIVFYLEVGPIGSSEIVIPGSTANPRIVRAKASNE